MHSRGVAGEVGRSQHHDVRRVVRPPGEQVDLHVLVAAVAEPAAGVAHLDEAGLRARPAQPVAGAEARVRGRAQQPLQAPDGRRDEVVVQDDLDGDLAAGARPPERVGDVGTVEAVRRHADGAAVRRGVDGLRTWSAIRSWAATPPVGSLNSTLAAGAGTTSAAGAAVRRAPPPPRAAPSLPTLPRTLRRALGSPRLPRRRGPPFPPADWFASRPPDPVDGGFLPRGSTVPPRTFPGHGPGASPAAGRFGRTRVGSLGRRPLPAAPGPRILGSRCGPGLPAQGIGNDGGPGHAPLVVITRGQSAPRGFSRRTRGRASRPCERRPGARRDIHRRWRPPRPSASVVRRQRGRRVGERARTTRRSRWPRRWSPRARPRPACRDRPRSPTRPSRSRPWGRRPAG